MTGPHWIKQWISDLALLNEQFRDDDGKVDFEALGREEYQFRMALITGKFAKSDRARDTFAAAKKAYDANVKNGHLGGRPPKEKAEAENGAHDAVPQNLHSNLPASAPRTCRPPRSFDEVRDFAEQNGLDYDDVRLWWERNFVERDGTDKDGKKFKNWKGALVNACKAEETKRRTA